MEKVIIRLKVHYDALNRTFELVDSKFNRILEGDSLYELTLPVPMYDEADVEKLISARNAAIGHA